MSLRRNIHQHLETFGTGILSGTIDDAVNFLNDIKNKYVANFDSVDIEYDGEHCFDVVGYKTETEEEYKLRIEKEKAEKEEARKIMEQKDYEIYQRLKKRFEPA